MDYLRKDMMGEEDDANFEKQSDKTFQSAFNKQVHSDTTSVVNLNDESFGAPKKPNVKPPMLPLHLLKQQSSNLDTLDF